MFTRYEDELRFLLFREFFESYGLALCTLLMLTLGIRKQHR